MHVMKLGIHLIATVLLTGWSVLGSAQAFPDRPITIVVPSPAGSATDNIVRPLANDLQGALGQPVVIDNRPGANGVIGAQYVAKAKPDGYTLLAGSSTNLAANMGLYKSLPYNPLTDFQPIAGIGFTSMIFVVRDDAPFKDVAGMLATSRKQGKPMTAGYGNPSAQVAIGILGKAGKVDFTPVPYKGTPQVITDLLGGVIDVGVVDVGNAIPNIKAGKIKAIAISASVRSVAAPDTPTLLEVFSDPATVLVTWIGLAAPVGTPRPIVDKLYKAIEAALAKKEIRDRWLAATTEMEIVGPDDLKARMQQDATRWTALIKSVGIQPE